MKALFLQPFGIGDCIFSINIARHFMAQGQEIIWPVLTHFKEGLQRAYPFIQWEDANQYGKYMGIQNKCVVDNMLIVPIRWSMEAMKCEYKDVMRAKYDMYDLDWTNWKEGAMFERNEEKENKMWKLASIDNHYKELVLIANTFGSNFQHEIKIPETNCLRHVYLINYLDFSIFDWALVMESAIEIHAVSSSNIYLFELLDIQCPIHIYKREPIEKDHRNYDYLLTRPNYIFH